MQHNYAKTPFGEHAGDLEIELPMTKKLDYGLFDSVLSCADKEHMSCVEEDLSIA